MQTSSNYTRDFVTPCASLSTNPYEHYVNGRKRPKRLCNRTINHPPPHRHYDPKTFQVIEEWE